MINTMLLLLAFLITVLGFIPLLCIQSYKHFRNIAVFHLGVAISFDHLWCKMLFGIDKHTVSAVVYKEVLNGNIKYIKYMTIINTVFNSKQHCELAYKSEYKG